MKSRGAFMLPSLYQPELRLRRFQECRPGFTHQHVGWVERAIGRTSDGWRETHQPGARKMGFAAKIGLRPISPLNPSYRFPRRMSATRISV